MAKQAAVTWFRIRGENGEPDSPTYEFDGNTMRIDELRVLSKKGDLGITTLQLGLAMGNAEAIVAKLWLAKTRAGEACRWEDFDRFDIGRMYSTDAHGVELGTKPADENEKGDEEGAAPADPPKKRGASAGTT